MSLFRSRLPHDCRLHYVDRGGKKVHFLNPLAIRVTRRPCDPNREILSTRHTRASISSSGGGGGGGGEVIATRPCLIVISSRTKYSPTYSSSYSASVICRDLVQ